MKAVLTLLLSFIMHFCFSQGLKVGYSYTYIWQTSIDLSSTYREGTSNVNFSIQINENHSIGLQNLFITTIGSAFNTSNDKSNYYIVGAFYQYDLLGKSKNELYPEASLNYGNFCPCGSLDPFENRGLLYLGYGGGFDYNVYRNFYLDLSFHWYYPINTKSKLPQNENVYSFTQYIFGLSYKFD